MNVSTSHADLFKSLLLFKHELGEFVFKTVPFNVFRDLLRLEKFKIEDSEKQKLAIDISTNEVL